MFAEKSGVNAPELVFKPVSDFNIISPSARSLKTAKARRRPSPSRRRDGEARDQHESTPVF